MQRNDWLFLTTISGALIVVGGIYVLWKFSNSASAAAWVQSIGAIAAIAVAIYFARTDRADRQASDRRKAYALAQSLTGSIFLLDIELNRVQRVVDPSSQQPPAADVWDRWFASAAVDIPRPLTEAMPLMQASEDDMVGRFRTAAMLAQTFNEYLVKFSKLNQNNVRNEWHRLYPMMAGQLALLRTTVGSITAMPVKSF